MARVAWGKQPDQKQALIKCGSGSECGGIGRHAGLRSQCFGVRVRVSPLAPGWNGSIFPETLRRQRPRKEAFPLVINVHVTLFKPPTGQAPIFV